MKKAAFIASVTGHIKCFHLPYLEYFKTAGYETYVLTKDKEAIDFCDRHISIPFERSPFSKNTFKAYRELKRVIDKENFDIIHCHTPVAAFLTRLATRGARKKGTKVLYTAHGFHFFKGAPLLNWLIYFPIEWLASFFTDGLITINSEDYKNATKYLHAESTYYTHGVGVDLNKFSPIENPQREIYEELNIPEDARILISVGELNKNKNHQVIIRAMSQIENGNIYYLIAGVGELKNSLSALSRELGIENRVKFLGYRDDISTLLKASDIFCFPSYREGLPVSVMEAMASGLPVVASATRGNIDLIDNNRGGFLCAPACPEDFKEGIEALLEKSDLRDSFAQYNKEKIKSFSLDNVKKEITDIYEDFIK